MQFAVCLILNLLMLVPARLPVPSRPGVLFFQQSPLATPIRYDTRQMTGEAMG